MNPENTQSPPSLPVPPTNSAPPPVPPSDDCTPIRGLAQAVEAMLRHPQRVVNVLRQTGAGKVAGMLLAIAFACSLVYGFIMGSFSGGMQYYVVPIKVAGGLFLSALICFPSLYIFACISGSTARLTEVAGILAGLMALMTVLLIGFAPVAWVFSQSTESLITMGILHLGFWIVACWFATRFLINGLRQISGRGMGGIGGWVIIFMLVMLQMTTALRPLIGTAPTILPTEKRFFLGHWFQCFEKSMDESRKPATPEKKERL